MTKLSAQNAQNKEEIMGIGVSGTSKLGLLKQIEQKVLSHERFYIVTPNPEIIVKAKSDVDLAKILNSADFSVPDGIGLSAAHYFVNLSAPKNKLVRFPVLMIQGMYTGFLVLVGREKLTASLPVIKGRELFVDLMKLAKDKNWRVYLLGGPSTLTAGQVLEAKYTNLSVAASVGPFLDGDGKPVYADELKIEKKTIADINAFVPHLLFVGFGAPKQEKWLARNLAKLNVSGAMVVGGTFDFVSGQTSLPPKRLESFEWLWRLITKKGHAGRVIQALVVFPWQVFIHKLTISPLDTNATL